MAHFTRRIVLALCLVSGLLAGGKALGQEQVALHGTVFNMYRTRPLEAVSVLCNSGRGTTTDSNGNYYITVRADDSIWFSYLGRATAKFAVSAVRSQAAFDIALHVDPLELKEVKVMPHNYRMDSLQNRKDYAKAFNFKKPGFKITSPSTNGGLGAGIDLDELINIFRFQRTRRALAFQNRLLEDEGEKMVDHRFSPYIVKKITRLDKEELDTFMIRYRPSIEFCRHCTDYDLFDYIKLAFKQYSTDRKERP